jgi:hypothetical protein
MKRTDSLPAALFLFFLFLIPNPQTLYAQGGLAGALDQIADQIGGGGESEDSGQGSDSRPSDSQETTPAAILKPEVDAQMDALQQQAAAPPAEEQDEFYPGKTLAQFTDPATGNTQNLVKMPDGSVKVVEKDADGNIVSETTLSPEDAAKLLPSEEGGKVEMTKRPDGQMEVRQYDRDGQLVSSEIMPAKELPSASMYDPATGITTASQKNPDGSRTVTKTDKDGNVISQEKIPPRGQGGASASSYDPKTGVTTTSRANPDGSHTVSKSKSWKDDKGAEHTQITDNRGNQTEIVKQNDGSTVTTQWDKDNNMTQTTRLADGSQKVVSPTQDGFIEEKVTRADGQTQVITKDHAGNVLETTESAPDGRTVTTDELGVRTVKTPEIDGTYTVEKTDAKGNQVVTQYDSNGNVLNEQENLAVPKESGERYFENELGGRPGEWEKLPQSAKNQYANSENQIKENVEAELLRERQAQEKIQEEGETARWQAEQDKILEEKLAKIAQEDVEAKARYAEFQKREELMAARMDAKNKLRDYDRQIYEARARGDNNEAERLTMEADAFSDQSMDLFELTDAEEKEVQRKQEIRERVTQRVTNQARNVADSNLIAIEGEQELKETVTGKAKYVSIGAEMQEQTKATTRAADRELAFAQAKQAEIARMLSDPKTTPEEREVLHGMLDLANLQESGAAEMLQSNAMLTAAGYGIDVAMTVTGSKLAGAAARGVEVTAGKLLAKETAARVVTATTETGVVTLAGQGVTKTATAVTSRVAGDAAAQAVERALTADVGAAASRVVGRETGEAAATAATTRILPSAADDAASATTRMGDDLTATQILPNAGREAAEAAAGRTTQMLPRAATEAEQATTRILPSAADDAASATTRMGDDLTATQILPNAGREAAEAAAGRTTQMLPRAATEAEQATTRILPNAADDAASATTRMGDDLTATQILPNAAQDAAEAAAGRTTQMMPRAATEAEQATTRILPNAADDVASATTRMVNPRAAADEAFRGAETQAVPQSTRIPPANPASRPPAASHAAAAGGDDALRAQNMARETALNERLAREAAEAQRTLEQRGADSLSAAEAAQVHTKIQTGALNRQTQGLLEEARKAGIPESRIKELTDMAHNPALPKRGASMANQNLVEEIARSRGNTILESEAAEPLLTTVVNVQTGAAGRQEVEILKRGIETAKQNGTDFFDGLSRQGTTSSDGYHPIADSQDIEALRDFAKKNRLIE